MIYERTYISYIDKTIKVACELMEMNNMDDETVTKITELNMKDIKALQE